MPTTDTFQNFRQQLGQKVQLARNVGMSQQQISDHAKRIGDWLAHNYDPQSPEQRLLKELWQVSDSHQQQAIAGAVVKLVGP